MITLGIETSCDETSVAVLDEQLNVRSHLIYSQIARHSPYGGVVPEVASRLHVEVLPRMLDDALVKSGVSWSDIGDIAVTRGPGLSPSLLIGVTAARSLGLRLNRPVRGINHIEGHIHSLFLDPKVPRWTDAGPLVVLMVSGGHTLLVHMNGVGQYRLLGQTLDDAAGEALDKGATLMGLGYPGGPEIEKTAVGGNADAIPFPRGTVDGRSARSGDFDPDYCFSYSGLKTALLYHLKKNPGDVIPPRLASTAASYQEAVFDALISRLERAVDQLPCKAFACVGGVAKNAVLRAKLDKLSRESGKPLYLAPLAYCTDNAAMIATAAIARRESGLSDTDLRIDPNLMLI